MNGVKIHRVFPCIGFQTINHRFYAALFFPSAWLKLFKLGKDAMILSQGFSANLAGSVYSRVSGQPLIIFFQGGDMGDYTEHAIPFSDILMGFIVRSARKAVCVSNYVAKRVSIFRPRACVIVPNGVDLHKFTPTKQKDGKPRVLLSVSRLTPKNGLDLVIQALPLVRDIDFWVVGEGDQRGALEGLAKKLGVAERVRFLGYVPHDRLNEYLHKAHAFIRVSRDEGFGIAYLEAMAAGIPIISTGVGGIAEFAVYEKCAFEPESIANAIQQVVGNTTVSERLAREGLQKAKEFAQEEICKKIEAELLEVRDWGKERQILLSH